MAGVIGFDYSTKSLQSQGEVTLSYDYGLLMIADSGGAVLGVYLIQYKTCTPILDSLYIAIIKNTEFSVTIKNISPIAHNFRVTYIGAYKKN